MRFASCRCWAFLLVASFATPALAHGQEFVRQTLVVVPLGTEGSLRTARQFASSLRARIARFSERRDLFVPGTDTLEDFLQFSGYPVDSALNEINTRQLAVHFRADEVVQGVVRSEKDFVEVRAELRLVREWRWRQPLPVVRGSNLNAVADTLARAIVRARAQMNDVRRCENAARSGDPAGAATFAEAGILAYRASTLARTCLVLAVRFNDVGADSVVRLTEDLLAIDSSSIIAAVIRARNLERVRSAAAAAEGWGTVLHLRPDSLFLALDAVEQLMRLKRPGMTLDAVRMLLPLHPGEPALRRIAFRADVALADWPAAAALGDSLDVDDPDFRDDSTYATRHIESLRMVGDTLAALAKSARTVRQHPGDVLVYLQYLQLIGAEQGGALPRGLARFPEAPELRVMAARSALSSGKKRDAIADLETATRLDDQLTQGFLQMAQLWFDLEEPDSAVNAMLRAPRSGPDAELLRMFALTRGRLAVRGASDSTPNGWRVAIALFSLADSVDSRDDSRGLLAAASLQLARSALVDASRTHDCRDANRALEILGPTETALGRGVGEGGGAQELREAFGVMRTATDNARRVYCTPPEPRR